MEALVIKDRLIFYTALDYSRVNHANEKEKRRGYHKQRNARLIS
jgi:hypothetical protein